MIDFSFINLESIKKMYTNTLPNITVQNGVLNTWSLSSSSKALVTEVEAWGSNIPCSESHREARLTIPFLSGMMVALGGRVLDRKECVL